MKRIVILPLGGLLLGCGGVQDAFKGAEATLAVSPDIVQPGQPYTVSWGGTRLTRTKSNDFQAPSGALRGQITDRTAVDVTYNYVAYGQNGSNPEIELAAKATVKVAKSARNIWVIGQIATAGPNQVADYMKQITTGTVKLIDRSDTTTPPPPSTDLLIIHPSYFESSAGPSDLDTLQKWSQEKRPVIFIGETTLKHFGGNNLSPIGGYFGGANGFTQDFLATERLRAGDGLVPISIKYLGARVTLEAGGGRGVTGIGGSADRIITTGSGTQAFTYVTADGARFAFSMKDGVGSTVNDSWYQLVLQSMARWCLDMS